MIARPKISRNEWKPAERGAFEVGNFALLSYRLDPRRYGDPAAFANTNAATAFHHVSRLVEARDWGALAAMDELARRAGDDGDGAGLAGYRLLGPPSAPTFRCVVGRRGLHYQHKGLPSFADRVLVRDPPVGPATACTEFDVVADVSTSDHKPIRAALEVW